MRIRINTSGLILMSAGLISVFVGVLLDNPVFYTCVALIYWAIGIIYSLRDIKHKFPLFSYNVGFFFFLLGGYLIDYLEKGDFSYFLESSAPASDEAVKHACFCLMLTAIIINAAYITFYKKNDEIPGKVIANNSNKIIMLRKILVFALVITYACELYCSMADLILVRTVSYRDSMLYMSNTSIIIVSLSSLYHIILFIYWATLPSKRATLISIASMMITASINLISGDRGGFISTCLLVCYFMLFRIRMGFRDIVIKKSIVVIAIMLVPFLMYGLQAISYTRNNQTYEENLAEGVASFVESQGGSVKIIAGGYDLDEKINNLVNGKRSFVFGEIKRYMKTNIFTRLLTGKSKALRTIEDAQSGESFLQSYGYTISPISYLNQVGGGSTYIAEVYYDGGYVFLGIFNLFIVFLLIKMSTGGSSSLIKNTIMFNIFRFIPLLPRGIALRWFTDTFAIQNLVVYFALWLFLHERSSGKIARIHDLRENRENFTM